jgi:PfaD family protein
VESGLDEIQRSLAGTGLPWGSNMIHSPNEPDLEDEVVEIYLRHDVRRVCASAYMDLTPSVVRFALSGLTTEPSGRVRRRRLILAKVSRLEVARRFLCPAPPELVQLLLSRGQVTPQEAALAARVPLAEDVTVESDSGGHTDNRPLAALFPAVAGLRDEIAARQGYAAPIRIGAAGGLGTPSAVAAAFALGAAYVMTGSVNQSSTESGLSAQGKQMLAETGIADVMMAPAADMFELGVRVQVLGRGTLFGVRARKLYELYLTHDSIEAIPPGVRASLERDIFRTSLVDVWDETRRFFQERDRAEVERAERDPRHRMALVFRWYLGRSSRWAIDGDSTRGFDYQIWCGPAMGAFNAWVAGTFLADPANRSVVQIGRNLLEGAAVVTRAQQLRSYGVPVPATAFDFRPRPLR